mgnify:CR=1 FL=1
MKKTVIQSGIYWIQWIVILVCLFVFWPVGLLLLWLKMRSDLKATLVASATLKVVAWVLVVVTAVVLIVALGMEGFSENSPVPGFIILLSGCVGLLVAASVTNKNALIYKRLINVVVNDGVTSIDDISRILNMPYDKVYRYLYGLLSRSLLKNAYISEVQRAVVFPDSARKERASVRLQAQEQEPEYTIVYCKSCGAHKEVVVGKIDTCNFCGSKLKG